MFVRVEEAERAEGAEKRRAPSATLTALTAATAFSALTACARIEPPPGGPPDRAPPSLIATKPDSFASLAGYRGVAEFQFDEVISELGAPNRGQGTGGLEKLVILSPTTNVPQVEWHRSRITVRPKEGWQPNRVYRVQLLPGVTDLRNNKSPQGAVLTFTTGAPRPQNTLKGVVVDWSTSRPAPAALVV
ncbi:MAG TPA: Ig-like domain-containing protein, partial [Gemmatimonadales bacterium]|nr:Ig-like domain-containing protein [Gemmatimonadales bacterium]